MVLSVVFLTFLVVHSCRAGGRKGLYKKMSKYLLWSVFIEIDSGKENVPIANITETDRQRCER